MKLYFDRDFRLCDIVVGKIINKFGSRTMAKVFPKRERVVAVAWSVSGIVGNGGFEYLLSMDIVPYDPNLIYTMDAFKVLKLKDTVDAIKKLLSFYPDGQIPNDEKNRMEIYNSIPENIRDQIDIQFYKGIKDLSHVMAAYIKSNFDVFKEYYVFLDKFRDK